MIHRLRVGVTIVLLASPTVAFAQGRERGFVQGFGGPTFVTESSSVFGGGFGLNVSPLLQITVEGGRIRSVLPKSLQREVNTLAAELKAEADRQRFICPNDPRIVFCTSDPPATLEFDVDVPSIYGMAGVRVLSPGTQRVRAFAEAGGGVARLSADIVATINRIDISALLEDGADIEPETKPLIQFGGGLTIWMTRRVGLDVGLRYTRIFTSDPVVNTARAYLGANWRF